MFCVDVDCVVDDVCGGDGFFGVVVLLFFVGCVVECLE